MFACKSTTAAASYVAYETPGRGVVVAEGYGAIADVLATGVDVASGRIKPPAAISKQAANLGETLGGQVENLNAIAEASASSPEKQKESAYREAQLWRFGQAESRFNQLASGSIEGLAPADRTEAYLNVAMNASNAGRFDEAEVYFKAAAPLVAEADAPWLRALDLNNRAAHARNQRKFEDAIALASQAIALRASQAEPTTTALAVVDGESIRLGRAASTALNSQGKSPSLQLSAEEREAVRDAQALQIMGTSQEALKRRKEGRESLMAAAAILERPRSGDVLGSAAPWLTARVQADIARMDRNAGSAPEAVKRLEAAITIYEKQDSGSLPLGHFLIELARAKAASGQEDEALNDFERAFGIFQARRGALGASADSAGAYFDILLQRIGTEPAKHQTEVERFFTSSEAACRGIHGRSLAAIRRTPEPGRHGQRRDFPGA